MTAGMNPRPANTQVFDPLLRLLHWGLALCVVLLIATSQLAEVFEHGVAEDTMWSLHILSGYGLALTLLARVLWGLVGPASARWRDLWHPAVWHHALLDRRLPRTHRIGHIECKTRVLPIADPFHTQRFQMVQRYLTPSDDDCAVTQRPPRQHCVQAGLERTKRLRKLVDWDAEK